MVKLSVKIFGVMIVLSSPASLPAAAVLVAGGAAVVGIGYGLHKASMGLSSTRKAWAVANK